MGNSFDVVTGGAGFIGSHICRALLKQGHSVRVVDNFSTGRRENLAQVQERYPDQCEIHRQDIRQLEELKKLFQGAGTVYHQAAMTSVQKSVEDPLDCNSVNVEGTLKVLLAARDAAVKKVIFASSTAVYGDSEVLPKHEEMKPDPISPYAVTKYMGEVYCNIFSEIYQLSTLSLRYFNVFGPNQDPESEYAAVIPRFITRALSEKPPIIYGDGEQSRDFIFVDEVVAANLMAAESQVQGLSLNIACGQRFTLNQLVKILSDIMGRELKPEYQAPRPAEVRHSVADIALAGKMIGFQPRSSFSQGLRQTVEWFQEKGLTV
ncbi:SDR family oxidoreductase [Acidobacteria bacterium AH-259-D05]|nr:SDR family oxidoreductase [Acidobacteria bacterium AH-259-D05]